jgi:phospholipid/cholesterol/gamma-HCH transport system substrate-binding protein
MEPGDEIRSLNRIRTDDLLKRLVKLMKTQHILLKTYSQSLKEINDGKGTVLLNDAEVARDLKKIMYYLKYQEEQKPRKT